MTASVGFDSKNQLEPKFDTIKFVPEKSKGNWLNLLALNPQEHWPKKYRYTVELPPGMHRWLSVDQRDHYEQHGFLVIKNVVPHHLIVQLANCISSNIQHPLEQLIRYPLIQNYLRCFCGPHSRHIQSHVFDHHFVQPTFGLSDKHETSFSQPAGSSRHPLHLQRHLPFLPFHNSDRLVGMMLSTQSMNDSRLAIWLQSGSHRSGRLETQHLHTNGQLINRIFENPQTIDNQLHTHSFSPLDLPSSLHAQDACSPKVIRLAPGDLFFFHPLLAHRLLFEENRPAPTVHQSQRSVNILALQLWFGAIDVIPIQRNFMPDDVSFNLTNQPPNTSTSTQFDTQDWLNRFNVHWHQVPESNRFFGSTIEEFDQHFVKSSSLSSSSPSSSASSQSSDLQLRSRL